MAEASDFKKIGTKGYKAWRILSASGAWAQVYRDREKMLRNYKSAIIFPEQFLGLNQNGVYKVIVSRTGNKVSSQIEIIRGFTPIGVSGEILDSLEKIREYEAANNNSGEVHRIGLGKGGQETSFHRFAYFSGIKDAVKYQSNEQNAHVSQIG